MHIDDLNRELDKIDNALAHAETYLAKNNEANASLHLSDRVLYSPLTTAVINARTSVTRIRELAGVDLASSPPPR